jgi:hypothetical protein
VYHCTQQLPNKINVDDTVATVAKLPGMLLRHVYYCPYSQAKTTYGFVIPLMIRHVEDPEPARHHNIAADVPLRTTT